MEGHSLGCAASGCFQSFLRLSDHPVAHSPILHTEMLCQRSHLQRHWEAVHFSRLSKHLILQ